jgi:crossover junction endodeoxyribonuclease RuvC
MRVLGIDPGTLATGYGVVCDASGVLRNITHGVIRTNAKHPLWKRLKVIHDGIAEVIEATQPEIMSIEQCFVGKNIQSALKLGHARGVAMLAGVTRGLSVVEFTPGQIKQAVTGRGRADKHQVSEMVRIILTLERKAAEDASDALAAAICQLNTRHLEGRLEAAR